MEYQETKDIISKKIYTDVSDLILTMVFDTCECCNEKFEPTSKTFRDTCDKCMALLFKCIRCETYIVINRNHFCEVCGETCRILCRYCYNNQSIMF